MNRTQLDFENNKLSKILVLALVLVLTLPAFAQQKKYPSLLWEITGKDMKEPSYLYGTMHVSNKIAFHLSDTFFMAIDNCDKIALETNPNDWMTNYLESDLLKIATSFMNLYNSNGLYEETFTLEQPDNKRLGVALSQDQSMMNSMLYRFSPGNHDFEENTFLDLFIYQAAKKQSKEVIGLEDFFETMQLFFKSQMPDKDAEKKKMGYSNFQELQELQEKIEEAYRKGDLDMLDSISELTYRTTTYRTYMLDIRNRDMTNQIDSILQHNSLFAGVGAAHLPGDSGMIEMLRQKGYTLRPVNRDVTAKSRKKMQSILNDRVAINLSTQTPSDGLFSIDLPGKLFHVPGIPGSVAYFYPEMTNGAAYTITRIKTNGAYFGKTANDYILKIDSMLYEVIPGNINSKKEIVVDGYPGFDIKNTNRRGDEQRYRVLITPFEVVIFKVGNTGKFKNKKEIDKVMNSIHFNPYEAGWSTFSPVFGEFEIELPKQRLVNNGLPEDNEGTSYEVQAIDPNNNAFFQFRNERLDDFDYIEQDTFELNQFAENFADKMDLDLVKQKTETFNSLPSVFVHYTNKDSNDVWARFIIKGAEYYMLMAKTDDREQAERFLNSFKVKSFIYEGEFKEHTDSTMYFTVKLVDQHPETSFMSVIPKLQMYALELQKDDEEEDNSHQSEDNSVEYTALSTGEIVHVEYDKYHLFSSFDSLEQLWDRKVNNLTSWEKYYEKSRSYQQSDSTYEMTVVVADSASSRVIKSKLILHQSVLYTLSATLDTLNEESSFVSTFFESFRPSCDTVIGYPLIGDKTGIWLDYMNGEDSLQKEWAISSTSYLEPADSLAPQLIDVYENFDYTDRPGWLKRSIMWRIANTEHKDVIPFLKKTYTETENNTDLQYAILKALARTEKEEAYTFIKKQLMEEPPLTNEYDAWGLFSNFHDSLELSAPFFPDFLELTTYPEYEEAVYYLLSNMLDSGVVESDLYKNQVNTLIRKANNELRRQFASEEDEDNSSYEAEVAYDDYDYYDYYDEGGGDYTKLIAFTKLLIPYQKNPKVTAHIDKLMTTKDEYLMTELITLFKEKELQIADSVFSNLSKSPTSRYRFYRMLEEMEDSSWLQRFDQTYLNHDSLIMARLYKNQFDDEKDSIQFLERKYVINRYTDGYVYIYKSKKEDDEEWSLDYAGPIPADSTDFDYEHVQFEREFTELEGGTDKEQEEELEEETEKIMRKMRCKGRERVVFENPFDFSGLFGY